MNDTGAAFRRGRVFVQGNYAGMIEEIEAIGNAENRFHGICDASLMPAGKEVLYE